MVTKAENGTISSVTPATAGKMFVGRAVDTSLLPGAGAAAVAGIGEAKILDARNAQQRGLKK
jgi:type VI secretion system secreted protein VgrG